MAKLFTVQLDINEERFAELLDEYKANNPDLTVVVRCRDCKHRHTPRCGLYYGSANSVSYFSEHGEDFYCSYGERKEARE